MLEKQDLKKQISDLKLELSEATKSLNEFKTESKGMKSELQRLQSEHFIAKKKLDTFESDHQNELNAYKQEVTDLEMKNKELDKKLKAVLENLSEQDREEAMENPDFMEEFNFGETAFKIDEEDKEIRPRVSSFVRKDSENSRRNSLRNSFSNNKLKGIAQLNNPSNFNEATQKEMQDKIDELEMMTEEAKRQVLMAQEQIDNLNVTIREERKKVEINKKKVDLRDKELEELRQKVLRDNERSSILVNEANEEVDEMRRLLNEARRKLKNELLKNPPQAKK